MLPLTLKFIIRSWKSPKGVVMTVPPGCTRTMPKECPVKREAVLRSSSPEKGSRTCPLSNGVFLLWRQQVCTGHRMMDMARKKIPTTTYYNELSDLYLFSCLDTQKLYSLWKQGKNTIFPRRREKKSLWYLRQISLHLCRCDQILLSYRTKTLTFKKSLN